MKIFVLASQLGHFRARPKFEGSPNAQYLLGMTQNRCRPNTKLGKMAKKTKVARPAAGAKKKGKDKSKGKKKEEPTKGEGQAWIFLSFGEKRYFERQNYRKMG